MLVATSCSNSGSPTAPTDAAAPGDASTETEPSDQLAFADDEDLDEDGRVVLDVAAWKGNEAEPAGLPQLIEAFEAEYPDIRINLDVSPRLDIDVVVVPQVEAGDPPDVMMTDLQLASALADQGLLVDLGVDSEWYRRLDPSLQDPLTFDDQIHMLPLEVIGMGNFVNNTLLSNAGIDEPPTTIDELLSACNALADADISPMIVTNFGAALIVAGNGLQATTAEPTDYLDGTQRFVDDPAWSAALDVLRDMIDNRCFDPDQQASLDPWTTGLTAFTDEQFAMMPQGAWNILSFTNVENLDFSFAPLPSLGGTGVGLDLLGIGWSVPSEGDQIEAARTFVEWFSAPDRIQVVLDDEAGYTPFDDGSAGTPTLAATYDQARSDGATIHSPVAVLEWPGDLWLQLWDSLTMLMLDPTIPNETILERLDAAVDSNS